MKKTGYWKDIENLQTEIEMWRKEHEDALLTPSMLKRTGRTDLLVAISKYHGGFITLRRRLGEELIRYPPGYWKNFENVRNAILAWQAEHGGLFPAKEQLMQTGHSKLAQAIFRYHGGFQEVRKKMCVPVVRHSSGYWQDFENVRRAIEVWMANHEGSFPTLRRLKETNQQDLVGAIVRHGGFSGVRGRLGVKLLRQNVGDWANIEAVCQAIEQWRSAHGGSFPTQRQLKAEGQGVLANAISRYGGFAVIRQRMGASVIKQPAGYWLKIDNVRGAVEQWVQVHGRFPNAGDLRRAKQAGLAVAITRHHGGFPALRVRMGYVSVSDSDIEDHADVLAIVVPQLSTSPFTLWSTMKSRWTRRDLDTAIAEYNADGSLVRFRTLVDG